DLQFDAGIISVLVFGAGTNYALLLISRYREELSLTQDHRAALASAWRHTAPAILASNVTVVLALLTLVLAVIPGTHGLGVASAIGLVIALAAVLFALPPALAMCGRRIFWPFKPVPGEGASQGRFWHGVAARVSRRPALGLVGGVLVLAIMAAGWFGTSIGLTQVEKFRVQSESAAGLEVVSEHFPPGESQPMFVVADSPQAEEVVAAAGEVDGVVRAHPVGTTEDGSLTKIMVVGQYAPGTDAGLDLVKDLRQSVHAVPEADALIGGQTATELDARDGTQRDLFLIAPLILAVAFLILTLLLRSAVAPLLLLTVNLASALAAIGGGAWLSRLVFTQDALDSQVPLLAFLFLVALGIDYTIFLVHRARTESGAHGTKEGIVRAVTHTGGVITSAGIVLAGVFAALGVLPLVVLGQLGIIVGLGVLVDTLIVRTVIVPAVFTLVREKIWWPRPPRPFADTSAVSASPSPSPGSPSPSAGPSPSPSATLGTGFGD
ncbi:MAG TPA: MMPL family transporter, partial [Beutenbergiaceae bacterium]|nr:MMPL family transporter [Beutenbergiaceae bacterium]